MVSGQFNSQENGKTLDKATTTSQFYNDSPKVLYITDTNNYLASQLVRNIVEYLRLIFKETMQ